MSSSNCVFLVWTLEKKKSKFSHIFGVKSLIYGEKNFSTFWIKVGVPTYLIPNVTKDIRKSFRYTYLLIFVSNFSKLEIASSSPLLKASVQYSSGTYMLA
jgi:hypothetical protein